jgi:hypothetical protein
MTAETVREVLNEALDCRVEVGTYRGVEGIWARIELDPRADYDQRPTSLACNATTVEEMKVRFVATTADEDAVVAALRDLEAATPATGEVSAKNHELSEDEQLWPHILYENLALSEAAAVLSAIESEPLPTC